MAVVAIAAYVPEDGGVGALLLVALVFEIMNIPWIMV